MTDTKATPTVESVARELLRNGGDVGDAMSGLEKWHVNAIARWALRFRAEGQREVLLRAADELSTYGHAPGVLRRLASEVDNAV